MEKKHILLVEDDVTLGYVLKEYLNIHGFDVIWYKNGKEGLRAFQEYPVDMCILDIMMPEIDGFELAKKIRNINSVVPLIFLTAKSMKIDKLKGFDLGADDYITKPVDEEELVARIKAILRRTSNNRDYRHIIQYKIGKYTFNYQNRTITARGAHVLITSKEAKLLKMLLDRKNDILQRDQALKEIWGKNDYFYRRSMDVHITKLRKYLDGDSRISIRNVHGKGYILSYV